MALVRQGTDMRPRLTALSPACRQLFIFGAGGEELHVLSAGSHPVSQMLWLGSDELLVAAGPEISVWTLSEGGCRKDKYDQGSCVKRMALSLDKQHLAVACAAGKVEAHGGSMGGAHNCHCSIEQMSEVKRVQGSLVVAFE